MREQIAAGGADADRWFKRAFIGGEREGAADIREQSHKDSGSQPLRASEQTFHGRGGRATNAEGSPSCAKDTLIKTINYRKSAASKNSKNKDRSMGGS